MRGTSSSEGVGQGRIRKLLRKTSGGWWHFMGLGKGVTLGVGGGGCSDLPLCPEGQWLCLLGMRKCVWSWPSYDLQTSGGPMRGGVARGDLSLLEGSCRLDISRRGCDQPCWLHVLQATLSRMLK